MMNNWARLGISALASLVLTVPAYLAVVQVLPLDFLLFFLAPGYWLGKAMPASLVDAEGGPLFIVLASAVLWTLIIFGVWLLIVRLKSRN
ncbi:MAG TPA: hypothetical protein VF791_06290 [Pyrinomonadaceae bacterium]